jgi:hypothetical protein
VAHVERLDARCPDGRVRWGDEDAVRHLLEDPTVADVAVPPGPDPAAPRSRLGDGPDDARRRRVDDVLTVMSRHYESVVTTVHRIEDVWSTHRERVASAAADIARAVEEATASGIAAPRTVSRVTTTLDELGRRVQNDPLSVRDDEIDDALRRAADAVHDLRRRVRLRATFDARAASVSAAVATARREAWSATAARLDARRWVVEDGRLFVRVSTTALRERADGLEEELRLAMAVAERDWELTERRLKLLAAEAAGLVADARACRRTSLEAVGTRDRLRGRLDAFRAKAAALGASDDDAFEELHRAAVEELYRAPCDLTRAEDLVGCYLAAVEAVPTPRPVVVAATAGPPVATSGTGGTR